MKQHLNRRNFFRATAVGGGVITVGLPLLEGMLNSTGTAYADDTTLPGIFGIWYAGGGVAPEAFIPKGTGANWGLPGAAEKLAHMRSLEPQALWSASEAAYSYPDKQHAFERLLSPELKSLFTVVTGLKVPPNYAQHRSGQTHVFSGSPERHNGTDFVMRTATADQIIADLTGTRSLVLEIADGLPLDGSPNQRYISWRNSADGTPVPVTPHYNALSAFEDLFGSGPPLSAGENSAKQSVLDYVRPRITALKARVSAADKVRLDEHFTALREIEADLNSATSSCDPDAPAEAQYDLKVNHDAMIRIAGLALSCGVRNVFSLTATRTQGQYQIPGGSTGQHSLQHGGFLGDGLHTIDKLKAAIAAQASGPRELRLKRMPENRTTVRFQMDLYADMLAHFATIPYGAGTLLDACGIVGSFEMWDGNHHGYEEHGLMVGGGANGKLLTGHHIRDENLTKPSEVMVSVMRATLDNPDELPVFGSTGHEAEAGYSAIEI